MFAKEKAPFILIQFKMHKHANKVKKFPTSYCPIMFIPMPFVNGSKIYSISINTASIYCIFDENTCIDSVIKTVEFGVFGKYLEQQKQTIRGIVKTRFVFNMLTNGITKK